MPQGHSIGLRQIAEDQFIVGAEALDSHYYEKHIPILRTLPQYDLLIENLPDALEDEPQQKLTILEHTKGYPATAPRVYVPLGNKWDMPPLPEKGDWSECGLYESIGRALSAWEAFESDLAGVFTALLSPSLFLLPAERAYGSILTFRGRSEMIEAAAEAFFIAKPNRRKHHILKAILKKAGRYSARRNEIAHGIVGEYSTPAGKVQGLALMPSTYSTNKRYLAQRGRSYNTMPRYAYTTSEIQYFEWRFRQLVKPTRWLAMDLYRYFADIPPGVTC